MSSLDRDDFSLGNSIPYVWSPLSDDLNDLNRSSVHDNDGDGGGSKKRRDDDDDNDDDLSIDDESYDGGEGDTDDKGKDLGISVTKKKNHDFPKDPFADLNEQGVLKRVSNTATIEEGAEEDDDDENDDHGDHVEDIENATANSNAPENDVGDKRRNIKTKLFPNELSETKPSNIHIPVISSQTSPPSLPSNNQDFKSIKSHPGSIHIKDGTDNASINSSIGESIELLTNINILSMADFLKLDEAQRVQAYRALADTAAETVTEIDEKRTEIFSMGWQVDELSRRVTDLIKVKVESNRKIKSAKEEIKKLKEMVEGDEKMGSLIAELEAKNVIIDTLKDSIDKSTLSPAKKSGHEGENQENEALVR